MINWDNTYISLYDENGELLAENLNPFNPGANAAGFVGASYGEIYYPDTGERVYSFSLKFANPQATDEHPAYDNSYGVGTPEYIASHRTVYYKLSGINIYCMPFEVSGGVSTQYIDYEGVREEITGKGVVLTLPFVMDNGSNDIQTGLFANGEYSVTVTDMFGNERKIDHTITCGSAENIDIRFSTLKTTSEPVVITVSSQNGEKVYVDVTDASRMSVEGNGTDSLTVTVTKNVKFSVKYKDSDGNVQVIELEVDNIVEPKPYAFSSNISDTYLTDEETGATYMYGIVMVTLQDDNFRLMDIYTGSVPSYTFVPGGPTSYTFKKDDIVAIFGEEAAKEITQDVTVTLPVDELRESINPMEQLGASDATGIKIKAYKEDRGYYSEIDTSLVLESALLGDAYSIADGEIRYTFSGKEISAASLIDALGWGTSFRFVTEISSNVGTKTFIKQGLYPGAPDYHTGYSDEVDGVTINGRLVTVDKNAEFTLYIVSKNGSYIAVAFNVDNIGVAPTPKLIKVPVSNNLVRVYVVAPEGALNFTADPADEGYEFKTDAEGEYAGVPYIEYSSNNDYLINYSFEYNDTEIKGAATANIFEIKVRELIRVGETVWSANKTLESTGNTVSATLTFNEVITGYEITDGSIDANAVTITPSGKQVKINFTDNHEGFTVRFDSAYGSVYVDIEAVTNIDRAAPDVFEVSRTLSSDGKTLTVVIGVSERAVFREGGYIGAQNGDNYYYTRVISENGSYTYHFVDMAGLETAFTFEVNEIVDENVKLYFSLTGNMEDAVTDPSAIDVKIGDVVYITPSIDVSIIINGGASQTLAQGNWLEMMIDDDLGGVSPFVVASDIYGNTVVSQFSQIVPRDTEAPILTVVKPQITVSVDSDRAEVEELLLKNVIAVDKDSELTYSVTFTDDLSVSGNSVVKYTVTDSSGNFSTAQCRLRIVAGVEPWVYINETQIDRDASYYAKKDEFMMLTVNVDGQPYCVYIEEGIKTVAQMKIEHTNLTDYYITDTEVEIGTLESGFYTVVIQTQSRDYFRIIIYVY